MTRDQLKAWCDSEMEMEAHNLHTRKPYEMLKAIADTLDEDELKALAEIVGVDLDDIYECPVCGNEGTCSNGHGEGTD